LSVAKSKYALADAGKASVGRQNTDLPAVMVSELAQDEQVQNQEKTRADSLIKEAKPKAFQENSTHQHLIRSREALNKFHPWNLFNVRALLSREKPNKLDFSQTPSWRLLGSL
jgi:hypothetical protein